MPVCFALVFSLSGAIGPIIGQNFGAGRWDRILRSLSDALMFVTAYCVVVSVLLWWGQDWLIAIFSLEQDAASLVSVFCTIIAITFIFNGAMFVANAAFNNLNRPTWSTALNMGKATLGTIPFVWLGGKLGGAEGVLIGQAVGTIAFGIFSGMLVVNQVRKMAMEQEQKAEEPEILEPSVPLTPFCSSRTYMGHEDVIDETLATDAKT